jgi:O-antigen ligase
MVSGQLASVVRWLGLFVLVGAWCLPGHYPPWPSIQHEIAIGVVFFFLCIAAWGMPNGDVGAYWPAPARWMLVLSTVPLVQFLAGQLFYLTDAVVPALYIAGFALAIVLGRNMAALGPSGEQWVVRFMTAILFAAVISVVLALFQWQGASNLWLVDLAVGGRPYANLAQPNHLATLMILGSVGIWLNWKNEAISDGFALFLAIWLILGLALTQSRTGWLAFMILLALANAHGRRYGGLVNKCKVGFVWVFLAVTNIAMTWLWILINQWLDVSSAKELQGRFSMGTRLGLWDGLSDAVTRAPWMGWGWGQVSVAQHAIALERNAGNEIVEYSHNLLIDFCLWMGVPSAVFWALLASVWVFRRAGNCRTPLSWAMMAALIGIFVHAFTEYPLAYLYFLWPAGFLIGVMDFQCRGGPDVGGVKFFFMNDLTVTRAVFFVLVSLSGWFVFEYYQVENFDRYARMRTARIGDADDSMLTFPDVFLLDRLVAYQKFRLTPARVGMTSGEIDEMRRVAYRHPYPPALLRLALATGLNGLPSEARNELQALCRLQIPAQCDDARKSWQLAQEKYPVLRSVPGP